MIWLRKLVFYVFLLIYIICCPLLILYSLGYFFKSGAERGIVKTGLIYLATVPPGAVVYLDNKRFSDETPAMIRDLLPGEYNVRMHLKGYRPWQRRISVDPGKASVFNKTLLLPENLVPVTIAADSGPLTQLLNIEETPWLILASGNQAGDLQAYNLKQEKIRNLLPSGHVAQPDTILGIKAWPESSGVLLESQKGEARHFWWIDLRDKETPPLEITELIPTGTKRKFFHTREDAEALYVLAGESLSRIDMVHKITTPIIQGGIMGAGMKSRTIYYMSSTQKILRASLDGEIQEVLLKDSELFSALFGTDTAFDIKILPKNILLFLNSKGKLISNRLPYELASEKIRGIHFYEDLRKAVVWEKDRIGMIDFEKSASERAVFERGPRISWIYQGLHDIAQAFWVYEASHIIFRDGAMIYLLELPNHGKPYLHELFKIKPGTNMFYSEENGKVYFVDEKTQKLTAVEILPKRAISFSFPDILEETKVTEAEEP